jgi:regulatory protein SWI6
MLIKSTAMTSMLTENLTAHKELLKQRTEQIDRLNEQLQELSAQQKSELEKLQDLKDRVKKRDERQAKIANLKRAISERKAAINRRANKRKTPQAELEPEWLDESGEEVLAAETEHGSPNEAQKDFLENQVPSPRTLRTRLHAFQENNSQLQKQSDDLRGRSTELEGMYRKVVSLCTGVAEDKVDENLPALVAAVESERGGLGEQEVGRVRDFLRRVDGVGGGPGGGGPMFES